MQTGRFKRVRIMLRDYERRWNNDENGGIIKIGTTVSNEIYNNKGFAGLPET